MPEGKHRSRTYRRVYVKLPGGKTAMHYRRRKPGKAVCSRCEKVLAGVPRERPYIMRKMAKTAKRPSRPYGGVLCSSCMRLMLKEKARK